MIKKINHIAFIMDGNRRYAKKNNLSINVGYKKGMSNFIDFIKFQVKYKVPETSFFALSCDNYEKRPDNEKETIYALMEFFAENRDVEKLVLENKIKIELKGNINYILKKEKELNPNKKTFIEKLNSKLNEWNLKNSEFNFIVNIALNYDGHAEILHSFNKIFGKIKLGEISEKEVNEKTIKENLWFSGNEPEIIVRPGNAPRLSGFMLWDSKYSEIYLTEKYWPELDEEDFKGIISWYENIQRNFGK